MFSSKIPYLLLFILSLHSLSYRFTLYLITSLFILSSRSHDEEHVIIQAGLLFTNQSQVHMDPGPCQIPCNNSVPSKGPHPSFVINLQATELHCLSAIWIT